MKLRLSFGDVDSPGLRNGTADATNSPALTGEATRLGLSSTFSDCRGVAASDVAAALLIGTLRLPPPTSTADMHGLSDGATRLFVGVSVFTGAARSDSPPASVT